jgi:PAS domain S-box-containing protein
MAPRAASRGLAAGLALVAGLAALDVAWGAERILTATVVLGPFATALLARERETAIVGALAVLVTIVSGTWNDNFGSLDYFVRMAVVLAGSAFAMLGARSRGRLLVDLERFRLLRAAAELGDATTTIDDVVRRVDDLLVPALADVCVIEVVRDGKRERLGIATVGPAVDLEALDASQRITVDLRTRGRALGSLTLARTGVSGRRFAPDEASFAGVLAGRIALALDNAGLSREVESLAARLTAALGNLAEAVTIQDRTGALIYANDAAARSLGFESPEALLATPPQDIVDAFESFHEDGSPLRLDLLPGRRLLAGEREAEPVLIRAINRQTGEERWRLTKATAVLDRDGRPSLAVNVIEDVTEVKRAEVTQRFLAQAGEVLQSSLDYEDTLSRVAELAVPALADWCSVSMPDAHGYLRPVALAHGDPEKVRLAREYNRRFAPRVTDRSGSPQVLRDGVSQVLNEIPDEVLREAIDDPEQLEIVRSIGMRAAMVVPMTGPAGNIGTISFVTSESGRPFTPGDLELAEELGRRAGVAVENARLYRERTHIAQTLQMSLLPGELPQVPGFALAALYRPAGEESFVGGDFYDAFATPRGWMVVVGDVTGRGAEAAALTAQARHTLRTAGALLGDPVAAIERLNSALVADPALPICTVAALLIEDRDETTVAHIACAGHPQPLLVRGGDVAGVGATGPMVGAWAEGRWSVETVELAPDDLLVLYTDGVTDAVGAGDRFGEARLAATLRGAATAPDAVARVERALGGFERGEQADDTAVLAVQRRSPARGGLAAAAGAGEASVHGAAVGAGHAGHEALGLDLADGGDRGGGDRGPGRGGAAEQVALPE